MSLSEGEMKAREAIILESEREVKKMLRAKTWEQKVQAIERMRRFDKTAKRAMKTSLKIDLTRSD